MQFFYYLLYSEKQSGIFGLKFVSREIGPNPCEKKTKLDLTHLSVHLAPSVECAKGRDGPRTTFTGCGHGKHHHHQRVGCRLRVWLRRKSKQQLLNQLTPTYRCIYRSAGPFHSPATKLVFPSLAMHLKTKASFGKEYY